MQLPHHIPPIADGEGADNWLHEGAVEREIGLRHAIDRRETALVVDVVAAERADIVERPCLAAHDPVAVGEIGIGRILGLRLRTTAS